MALNFFNIIDYTHMLCSLQENILFIAKFFYGNIFYIENVRMMKYNLVYGLREMGGKIKQWNLLSLCIK